MTPTIFFIVLVIVLGLLALGWSFSRRQQCKPALEPGSGTSGSVPLPGKQVSALRTRLSCALAALSFAGLTLLLFPQPQALAASAQQLTNRGSFAPTYTNRGSYLTSGQYLRTNDYLEADNGQYFAIMQSDGNFVLYRGSGPSNNLGAYWATNTWGQSGGQFFAQMGNDGNFCVIPGSGPSANEAPSLWCSRHSSLTRGNYFAIMQSDANFCVYHGTGPSNNLGAVWCTGTVAGVGTKISIHAGNNQPGVSYSGYYNPPLASFAPISVELTDSVGNPLSGKQVNWSVTSHPAAMAVWINDNGGTSYTTSTDSNGIATLDEVNGNSAVTAYAYGTINIVASSGSASVTFTETVYDDGCLPSCQ